MTSEERKIIHEFYLKDVNASRRLASALSPKLDAGDIITFEGTLGAGKTEFCRALIHASGFDEDVPSPTFNLVQVYDPPIDDVNSVSIWHMDLYRLEEPQEIFELGIEEAFDTAISLIEWPDRMGIYLPDEHLHIKLDMSDIEGERKISFFGSEYWRLRLRELDFNE